MWIDSTDYFDSQGPVPCIDNYVWVGTQTELLEAVRALGSEYQFTLADGRARVVRSRDRLDITIRPPGLSWTYGAGRTCAIAAVLWAFVIAFSAFMMWRCTPLGGCYPSYWMPLAAAVISLLGVSALAVYATTGAIDIAITGDCAAFSRDRYCIMSFKVWAQVPDPLATGPPDSRERVSGPMDSLCAARCAALSRSEEEGLCCQDTVLEVTGVQVVGGGWFGGALQKHQQVLLAAVVNTWIMDARGGQPLTLREPPPPPRISNEAGDSKLWGKVFVYRGVQGQGPHIV